MIDTHPMQKQPGDSIERVRLPAIDGSVLDTDDLKGKKFLLTFMRFAGCPFCNLRIHELVQCHANFGNGFTVVAIFDSPLDNLMLHAEGHKAPFPIVADASRYYYQAFGIEQSLWKTTIGAIKQRRMLSEALKLGYFPKRIKGKMTTMPADFLINEQGKIDLAHYGRDEGDHLSIVKLVEYSYLPSQFATTDCKNAN